VTDENKSDGIEVDKINFDVNGMPEGLDDGTLDGIAGGLLDPNHQGDCGTGTGSGTGT
jgi:hypothetical protein